MRRLLLLLAPACFCLGGASAPSSYAFARHRGSASQRDAHVADAALAAAAAAAGDATATRLRVERLAASVAIDTARPRFSWALAHPRRAEAQTAYRIVVARAADGAVAWDSGKVGGAATLNVAYNGSAALLPDTDFVWTVTSWDSEGLASAPASAAFSTALFADADWRGAQYVSSAANGSLNTYRAEFSVPGSGAPAAAVARARLYLLGLGYAKALINGELADDHELGSFTTFERRALYLAVDVTALVRTGCNALGVMVGHGWFAQPSVNVGPRQFRALLSVTTADGATSFFASTVSGEGEGGAGGGGASALTFAATAGPVTADDIYVGETYDGRVAASLSGWARCGYSPAPGVAWAASVAPAVTPATLGSVLGAHRTWVRTDREYAAGLISQPLPGVFVLDFEQHMAMQVTLRVSGCPAGTVITMQHAEMLFPNGSVHNQVAVRAPMVGTYICAGDSAAAEEVYDTLFTYYGARFVQISGLPGGVPGERTLTARFVHSDVPQSGDFSCSSALLNAITHATRASVLSNFMDVPTDCPSRERRSWLGDAQSAADTAMLLIDGGDVFAKWLGDLGDTQDLNRDTLGMQGALPDCSPFYNHGHVEADPGWGIALFSVADAFVSLFDDAELEAALFPRLRSYAEHWVALAANASGHLPVAWWGDWANYEKNNYRPAEWSDFFFCVALAKTLAFAQRLGLEPDVARYSQLLADARSLYLRTYYNATSACYSDCGYVPQLLGLALGLQPEGGAEELRVWASAVQWWAPGGAHALWPGHFGGGIVARKLVMPLLDRFGMKAQGLAFQLQTDAPSIGAWVAEGATSLWESLHMTATNSTGVGSYNHQMFASAGAFSFSSYAGIGRAEGSRSWRSIVIKPPAPAEGVNLSWAAASIDTPMGLVATLWTSQSESEGGGRGGGGGAPVFALNATLPANGVSEIWVPTVIAPSSAELTVAEGGIAVWKSGAFQPGAVAGLFGAAADSAGPFIVFRAGSGAYAFEVFVQRDEA
jgi:alpha-L-rhamnosidase